MKQLNLLKPITKQKFFGGALLHGRRKSQRPLSRKNALHIVLKSQWATNQNRFTTKENRAAIKGILRAVSEKYRIRIYRTAICSNHVHLVIRSKQRWLYRCFISVVTGLIAQHIMNGLSFKNFMTLKSKEFAGEGVQPQGKDQAFWLHRPFTRIINWGRDFKSCLKYLSRNTLEALGFIAYKPRPDYYARWRIISSANPVGS